MYNYENNLQGRSKKRQEIGRNFGWIDRDVVRQFRPLFFCESHMADAPSLCQQLTKSRVGKGQAIEDALNEVE
jgi:hypothetical protein